MLALVYAYHLTPLQHSDSRIYAGEPRCMTQRPCIPPSHAPVAYAACVEDLRYFPANITNDLFSALESWGVVECGAPTLSSEQALSASVNESIH
jgi:hypothetical protein